MSKGRYVDIFVEPDGSQPNGYKFSMEEDGVGKSMLTFNKTHDRMKKSERYEIEFKLHNRKGADLNFSKKQDKVLCAMIVPKGTEQCPPEGSSVEGLYVDPTEYPKDHKLHVINTDMNEEDIAFALYFVPDGTVEGPGTQYICYDPIIRNQNGGDS